MCLPFVHTGWTGVLLLLDIDTHTQTYTDTYLERRTEDPCRLAGVLCVCVCVCDDDDDGEKGGLCWCVCVKPWSNHPSLLLLSFIVHSCMNTYLQIGEPCQAPEGGCCRRLGHGSVCVCMYVYVCESGMLVNVGCGWP